MFNLKRSAISLAILAMVSLTSAVATRADTITFVTPPGATNPSSGEPVNASATLTVTPNILTIVVTNLQANPNDVSQNISDINFTANATTGTGSLTSSSGQEISVATNGTVTLGGTVSTGWGLTAAGGNFHLSVLGAPAGPAHTIIGPPGPGGVYSNGNGSINGNGPHNPFLNQTATFTLTVPGLVTEAQITSFNFSFGTTEGVIVPGTPGNPVPELASLLLLGSGLVGVAAKLRRRSRK